MEYTTRGWVIGFCWNLSDQYSPIWVAWENQISYTYQQYIIMLLSLSLSLFNPRWPPPLHPLSSFDLFSHHFHLKYFRFWQIYWKQMYQFCIILSCHFKLWRHCIVWHIPSLFETKMFYQFIVKHIW